MPVVLRAAHKATIRRAPSLEENLENTTSLNIPLITTTNRNDRSSHSSKTSILKHSPSPSPRMVSFEDKSSGSERKVAPASGSSATVNKTVGSGEEESRRSETVVKVEAINNNLSSSVSKKSTEPIPSSRKSLLRNEITNVPVTSFDPSEKFHNSVIVAKQSLTSMSNSTGESTTASAACTSSITSNTQSTGQQNAAASALQAGSNSTSKTIHANFPGVTSPQQRQQNLCVINSVAVDSITNTMTITPAPTVASAALPSELIAKNNGSNTVVTNNIIITSADPKMRINSKKLAKALSVVEESPKMERKYEISSPNPV